jgi:hypothetical protein
MFPTIGLMKDTQDIIPFTMYSYILKSCDDGVQNWGLLGFCNSSTVFYSKKIGNWGGLPVTPWSQLYVRVYRS